MEAGSIVAIKKDHDSLLTYGISFTLDFLQIGSALVSADVDGNEADEG